MISARCTFSQSWLMEFAQWINSKQSSPTKIL
jgi:hypothetical protein